MKLRHIVEKDLEDLWRFVSDKDATRYLTWDAYRSKDDLKKFIEATSKKTRYPDAFFTVEKCNRAIGTVHTILRDEGFIQFGFGIECSEWGKGIGTKIVARTLDILKTWPLENLEVVSDIHQDNIAAVKVVEKNGFTLKKKDFEKDRDRYSIMITLDEKDRVLQRFIETFRQDDRVAMAYLTGSAGDRKDFSDLDLLVVCREESGLSSILREMKSISSRQGDMTGFFSCTPSHFFAIFKNLAIFDISVTTLAFLWGIQDRREILSKDAFISDQKDSMRDELLIKGMTSLARAVCKLEKKNYWVVPRFLASAREESILPLLSLQGYDVKNIISVDAKDKQGLLVKTFAKPERDSLIEGIRASLGLLIGLDMNKLISSEIGDINKKVDSL